MKAHIRRGHFRAHVRNGIAGDFRTDEGFDKVDEMLVAQKFKGAAAAGGANIGTAVNLIALVGEAGQARLKGLIFVEPGYLALLVECTRYLVDDDMMVLDERLEIVVCECSPSSWCRLFCSPAVCLELRRQPPF